MAKFPFTNFFDRNGNGQMDFTEELLAMKVFEDALPGEEPASYDEMENDGLDGLDDLDDGLSDEMDEEDTDSLIDPDLTLHSPDFLEEDSDEDAAIWDDLEEDDEDVWEDSQEEAEGPVAYLTFSVESREERFAKQGIRREDYPSQRAYDAACDLLELQNGEGYVPPDSTRQREIERRQFLVEGSCVAARYLTVHDGFLYAQAVKENFPLPIQVPDEDERPATALDELFLDLAEEDPALAVRVWAWIIKEFGPYPQYMDGVWMPFNGLLHITDQFPPEFQEIALEELCQNSDFRRGLLEASPEFPDAGGYIAYALSRGREGQAATLLKSALKNPHGKGVQYEELVQEHHLPYAGGPGPGALGGPGAERCSPSWRASPTSAPSACCPSGRRRWPSASSGGGPGRRPSRPSTPTRWRPPTRPCTPSAGCGFPGWQRVYYYRTDDETLSVGDQVLVPGRDGPTPAEVVSIQKHRRDTAPYPVDRAKFVVGRYGDGNTSETYKVRNQNGTAGRQLTPFEVLRNYLANFLVFINMIKWRSSGL